MGAELLSHQDADGQWAGGAYFPGDFGWDSPETAEGGGNCEWVEGSVRSSFHSTLNSLKGILEWEERTGDTRLRLARHAAHEYLLRRRMLYRESTGELVAPWATHFGIPARHDDVRQPPWRLTRPTSTR